MGLDMYLEGEKFLWTDWENPKNIIMEDGFKLSGKTLELGYWRKHPDLHEFIVQTFMGGVDECQRVDLNVGDLRKILAAVKEDRLPRTGGWFFGGSRPEDKEPTIKILEGAIEWLEVKEKGVVRSVYYVASW